VSEDADIEPASLGERREGDYVGDPVRPRARAGIVLPSFINSIRVPDLAGGHLTPDLARGFALQIHNTLSSLLWTTEGFVDGVMELAGRAGLVCTPLEFRVAANAAREFQFNEVEKAIAACGGIRGSEGNWLAPFWVRVMGVFVAAAQQWGHFLFAALMAYLGGVIISSLISSVLPSWLRVRGVRAARMLNVTRGPFSNLSVLAPSVAPTRRLPNRTVVPLTWGGPYVSWMNGTFTFLEAFEFVNSTHGVVDLGQYQAWDLNMPHLVYLFTCSLVGTSLVGAVMIGFYSAMLMRVFVFIVRQRGFNPAGLPSFVESWISSSVSSFAVLFVGGWKVGVASPLGVSAAVWLLTGLTAGCCSVFRPRDLVRWWKGQQPREFAVRAQGAFLSAAVDSPVGDVPGTPDINVDIDDDAQVPVSRSVTPQAGRRTLRRVSGVMVFGTFVPRATLMAVEGVVGGLKPPFRACAGYDQRLEDRVFSRLQRVDVEWLARMVRCSAFEAQGLRIVCPKSVDINVPRLVRLLRELLVASSERVDLDEETLALVERAVEPQMMSVPTGSAVSPDMSTFLASTYAVLRVVPAESLAGQHWEFLLDAIALMHDVATAADAGGYVIAWDRFYRRWSAWMSTSLGETLAYAGQGFEPQTGNVVVDLRDKVLRSLVEGVVVVFVCRVLGLSKDFADVTKLGAYLKDHVISTSKNVFDMIVAVVRVIASGDWSNFAERVFLRGDPSSVAARVDDLKQEVKVVDLLPPGAGEHTIRVSQLYAVRRRVTQLKEDLVLLEQSGPVLRCRAIEADIDYRIRLYEAYIDANTSRREPIIFLGHSDPGTGKSMLKVGMENALARALGISTLDAQYLSYVWAPSEKFQEGYRQGTRVVYMDEFMSVVPDYDADVGAQAYSVLSFGSAVPTWVPKAFEQKGTVTTKHLLGVVINSNSPMAVFEKVFAGDAANFIRRVKRTTMEPRGAARTPDGKFNPHVIPESDQTLDKLGELLWVKVEVPRADSSKVKKASEVEWQVEFHGSFLAFCDYLTDQFLDRVKGESHRTSKWLNSVREYKVKPQGLVADCVTALLVVAGVAFLIPPLQKYLFVLLPRTWQVMLAFDLARYHGWMFVAGAYEQLVARFSLARFQARLRVEELRLKARHFQWRAAVARAREFLASPVVATLLAFACVAGATAMYSRKEKGKPVEPQGFKMPLRQEVADAVGPALEPGVSELVPPLQMAVGESEVYTLYRHGTGMQMNALDKVRAHYVRVNVEVPGQAPTACWGLVVGGLISTVAHVLPVVPPPGSRIVLSSCVVREQVVPTDLQPAMYHLDDLVDESFVKCALPGARDVLRTMSGSRKFTPKVGDRVRAVFPSSTDDLNGTVVEARMFARYPSAFDKRILRVNGFLVRWDERQTQSGDCGIRVVVQDGPAVSVIGVIVAIQREDGPTCGTTMVSFVDVSEYPARLERVRPRLTSCPELTVTPQSWSLQYEWPDVVEESPTRGVFAYPELVRGFRVSVIGRSEVQAPPPRTRLVPSPFSAVAREFMAEHMPGVEYAPAVQETVIRYDDAMGANRYVSPFESGLMRGSQDRATINLTHLEECMDGLFSTLEPAFHDEFRLCTIDEALRREAGFAPVDPTKSAALPEPGKKGAFMWETHHPDTGEVSRVADDRLRGAVLALMARLASGELVCGRSRSSLKDELLEVRKIEMVKTRIFECVPFDQYLLNRMIFLHFAMRLVKAMRVLGVCIGINASSKDWNWVDHRTRADLHGGVLSAMDYSRMDKNFLYLVHIHVANLIVRMFRLWLERSRGSPQIVDIARGLMWMELMSQRLIDGAYVFSYGGNSSGSFWTTIFNCLVSIAYVFLCYRRRTDMTWRIFLDEVLRHACFYGDDTRKLFRVPAVTLEVLAAEMWRLGQEVTAAGGQKGDLVVATDGGKTFLRRGFRRVGERVYCPLEVASLCKSLLCFVPSGDRAQDVRRHVACLTTLWEEAFFHEDVTRDQLRGLVQRCVRLIPGGDTIRFVSDEELAARWAAGTFRVWEL
jgi:hypothetical protein